MDKIQVDQNNASAGTEDERTGEVSTSTIAISPEIMARHNVSMMANDWIPSEPLPAGPKFSEEEYRRDTERMRKIVPSWALNPKKGPMLEKEGKAPSAPDNPLR